MLGRYTAKPGRASVVVAPRRTCTVAFIGTPGPPARLLRALALGAGAHAYVAADAAVTLEAAGNALLVHCALGDAPCAGVRVQLPMTGGSAATAVYSDTLEGPAAVPPATSLVCENCTSFDVVPPMEAGGVRVFWIR